MKKLLFSLIAFLMFNLSIIHAENIPQWITLAKNDDGYGLYYYQIETEELIEKAKIFRPESHIFINIRLYEKGKQITHRLILFDFKNSTFKVQQQITYDLNGNYINSYVYPYNWAIPLEGSFSDRSFKGLLNALTTKEAWDIEEEITIPLDVPLKLP
jgi:hypothetical protein